MTAKHFKRGSGCFTCSMCGKRTRDVNNSNGSLGLCELCEEKSGAGNSLSDAGYCGDAWSVFSPCTSVREVHSLLTVELGKLGR